MSNYIRNLVGFDLPDEEKGKITFPFIELTAHVMMRATQAGVILGSLLIGPISAVVQGRRGLADIGDVSIGYGRGGFLIGLLLGPLLASARVMALNTKTRTKGVFDRAYRLRHNKNQVFVDRLSIFGTFVGIGLAYCLNAELMTGLVFGFGGGCFFAAAYLTIFGSKP